MPSTPPPLPTPPPPLPPALDGRLESMPSRAGRIAFYVATEAAVTAARPLLLVHSVNAAASAFEVKPLFDHYRSTRPVYALDLPGYGFSDRSDRVYTLRLMTDAVLALAEAIAARHDGVVPDAVGVSLSCEFVARAASERPGAFHSVGLVSPTGLDRRGPRLGPPGGDRGQAWLLRVLGRAPWSGAVYRLLTRPGVIRFFLAKTWGSKDIDEGLLAYDVLTTQQPGACHAPFYFVSAFLFSADITAVYDRLSVPVWVVHGTRGDFVDYRGASRYAGAPHWRIDTMAATGALPYFEDLPRFAALYDAFLATVLAAPTRSDSGFDDAGPAAAR